MLFGTQGEAQETKRIDLYTTETKTQMIEHDEGLTMFNMDVEGAMTEYDENSKLWHINNFRYAGSIRGSSTTATQPITLKDVGPGIRKKVLTRPGAGSSTVLSVIGDRMEDTMVDDAIFAINGRMVGDPNIIKDVAMLFRNRRTENGFVIVPTLILSTCGKNNKSDTPVTAWGDQLFCKNSVPYDATWEFSDFMNTFPKLEIYRQQFYSRDGTAMQILPNRPALRQILNEIANYLLEQWELHQIGKIWQQKTPDNLTVVKDANNSVYDKNFIFSIREEDLMPKEVSLLTPDELARKIEAALRACVGAKKINTFWQHYQGMRFERDGLKFFYHDVPNQPRKKRRMDSSDTLFDQDAYRLFMKQCWQEFPRFTDFLRNSTYRLSLKWPTRMENLRIIGDNLQQLRQTEDGRMWKLRGEGMNDINWATNSMAISSLVNVSQMSFVVDIFLEQNNLIFSMLWKDTRLTILQAIKQIHDVAYFRLEDVKEKESGRLASDLQKQLTQVTELLTRYQQRIQISERNKSSKLQQILATMRAETIIYNEDTPDEVSSGESDPRSNGPLGITDEQFNRLHKFFPKPVTNRESIPSSLEPFALHMDQTLELEHSLSESQDGSVFDNIETIDLEDLLRNPISQLEYCYTLHNFTEAANTRQARLFLQTAQDMDSMPPAMLDTLKNSMMTYWLAANMSKGITNQLNLGFEKVSAEMVRAAAKLLVCRPLTPKEGTILGAPSMVPTYVTTANTQKLTATSEGTFTGLQPNKGIGRKTIMIEIWAEDSEKDPEMALMKGNIPAYAHWTENDFKLQYHEIGIESTARDLEFFKPAWDKKIHPTQEGYQKSSIVTRRLMLQTTASFRDSIETLMPMFKHRNVTVVFWTYTETALYKMMEILKIYELADNPTASTKCFAPQFLLYAFPDTTEEEMELLATRYVKNAGCGDRFSLFEQQVKNLKLILDALVPRHITLYACFQGIIRMSLVSAAMLNIYFWLRGPWATILAMRGYIDPYLSAEAILYVWLSRGRRFIRQPKPFEGRFEIDNPADILMRQTFDTRKLVMMKAISNLPKEDRNEMINEIIRHRTITMLPPQCHGSIPLTMKSFMDLPQMNSIPVGSKGFFYGGTVPQRRMQESLFNSNWAEECPLFHLATPIKTRKEDFLGTPLATHYDEKSISPFTTLLEQGWSFGDQCQDDMGCQELAVKVALYPTLGNITHADPMEPAPAIHIHWEKTWAELIAIKKFTQPEDPYKWLTPGARYDMDIRKNDCRHSSPSESDLMGYAPEMQELWKIWYPRNYQKAPAKTMEEWSETMTFQRIAPANWKNWAPTCQLRKIMNPGSSPTLTAGTVFQVRTFGGDEHHAITNHPVPVWTLADSTETIKQMWVGRQAEGLLDTFHITEHNLVKMSQQGFGSAPLTLLFKEMVFGARCYKNLVTDNQKTSLMGKNNSFRYFSLKFFV